MFQAQTSALLFGAFLSGCSPAESLPDAAPIAPELAALVGEQAIGVEEVEAVCRAKDVDPDRALEAMTRDALFAEAFLRQQPARAAFLRNTVLARSATEQFAAQALAAGPPQADEISALTARNWWQMDRPAMTRVTHAAVLLGQEPADVERRKAKEKAERLRELLAEAKDLAEFCAIAENFEAGAFSVKVEDLNPVAGDGRAVNPKAPPPPGMDPEMYSMAFAKAAESLSQVGAQSPVVATEFGYHVLLCTEKLPALKLPLAERRAKLEQEVMDNRAAHLQKIALAAQRAKLSVDVETSAVTATEVVQAPR